MSRRRRIVWLSAGGMILLILIGLSWALLSTEWGLHRVWSWAAGRLPEGLTVESVGGRLRSPLRLDNVVFRSGAATVRVGRIHVEWSLPPLLRRTFPVHSLRVDDVDIELHATGGGPVEPPAPLPPLGLPITARVEHATAHHLSVLLPGDSARPVTLDSLDVRGLVFRERMDVDAVRGAGPDGAFAARGWVEPRGPYPLELEVEIEARLPELPTVRGHLAVVGTLQELAMTAGVTEPLAADLVSTVQTPRYQPTFEARLLLTELDTKRLRDDWPEVRVHGRIDAGGGLDSVRARLSGRVETPQVGTVDLDGTVHGMGSTLVLEGIRAAARGIRAHGSGRVVLGGAETELDLDVNAAALRWPLNGAARVRVDTMWTSVRGTTRAYRLDGGARGSSVGGPPARVRLRGTGSRERLDVAGLRVDALDGSLHARGRVAWTPVPMWDLAVALDEVDPSQLLPDSLPWQGRISARGSTKGTVGAGGTEGSVLVEELRGVLRDEDVTGIAAARFAFPTAGSRAIPPRVFIDSLDVAWGPNAIRASGTLSDTLDLGLGLTAPDVGVVLPDAVGYLEIHGEVFGERRAPAVRAAVVARGFAHEQTAIEDLTLDLQVDSDSSGVVDVRGLALGVSVGATRADSLTLSIRGVPERHEASSRLRGPRGVVELEAAGGVVDRTWTGVVHRLDLDEEAIGAWTLVDSASVALSPEKALADGACWRSVDASACADGQWEVDGALGVRASIRDLSLQRFESSMPEGWSVSGVLTADAELLLEPDRRLAMEARAQLTPGRIDYPGRRGGRSLFHTGTYLEATTDSTGSRVSADLRLSNEESSTVASLAGWAELPGFTRLDQDLAAQPLRSRLEASVTDFSAVEAILQRVEDVRGDLSVDLAVSGTVGAPELDGEARLRAGQMDVPRLGLQVRDANLTMVGRGREGFTLEGQASSGPGAVHVSGTIPAVPTVADPGRLTITGDRFQVLDLPEATVWVSPALDVAASAERVDLTGRVDVPRARAELNEVSPAGVAPSRDVVFVGDSTITARVGPDIFTDVRITLGDSVSFRGFGLSADPRGTVVATDEPGRATTATGEILLTNGRYRAYGQELTIERGRILYAGGPLDNPGLDVRATRRARDGVVAGLDVRGTVRYPEVTIFSDPVMTQSEALAYIVLGRPLGTASPSEGNRVAGAAASLGIRGGNVLAGRIAQRIGLDEVRIEAEGPLQAASLVAGTYLSPRLYVSYGVGLFEPINTFRMRYSLSRLWTFQAETGKATGADLLYRIEGGR